MKKDDFIFTLENVGDIYAFLSGDTFRITVENNTGKIKKDLILPKRDINGKEATENILLIKDFFVNSYLNSNPIKIEAKKKLLQLINNK